MVKKLYFFLTAIFLLLLISCHLDVIGLFRSDDLEARLVYKNTFNFLRDEDRTLTLEDTFTFIVLTDTHILDRNAHGLERLAEEIIESDAFVVILGDITENGKQEDVERFIEIARTFGIPTFPLIGNHDIYFNTWHIWRDLIGSTSYRINGTNTTLFILDSANAFLGREQLNWLERELKSAVNRLSLYPLLALSPSFIITLIITVISLLATLRQTHERSLFRTSVFTLMLGRQHHFKLFSCIPLPYEFQYLHTHFLLTFLYTFLHTFFFSLFAPNALGYCYIEFFRQHIVHLPCFPFDKIS